MKKAREKRLGEMLVKLSVANLLADVIDSLMKDVEDIGSELKLTYKHSEKRDFVLLLDAAKVLRTRAKIMVRDSELGGMPDVFCDNAEFLELLIIGAVQAVGSSDEKREQLLNYINEMK
jgi:hypothetical protein